MPDKDEAIRTTVLRKELNLQRWDNYPGKPGKKVYVRLAGAPDDQRIPVVGWYNDGDALVLSIEQLPK